MKRKKKERKEKVEKKGEKKVSDEWRPVVELQLGLW